MRQERGEDEPPQSWVWNAVAAAWSSAVQLVWRQVATADWKAVLEHTQVASVLDQLGQGRIDGGARDRAY